MKHAAAGVFTADGVSLEPESWHAVGDPGEPGFVNGWGPGAETPLALFGPARFYLAQGRCYVTGVIAGGTPSNDPAFTLPEGYRPDFLMAVSIVTVADDPSSFGSGRAAVTTGGDVVIAAADEDNAFLNFDFRIA